MQPMVHYIPLKKDFSNITEVLKRFRDPALRAALTDNAYRDLVASGRHSYATFVEQFDQTLRDAGLQPALSFRGVNRLERRLRRQHRKQALARNIFTGIRNADFPGTALVRPAGRALIEALERWR